MSVLIQNQSSDIMATNTILLPLVQHQSVNASVLFPNISSIHDTAPKYDTSLGTHLGSHSYNDLPQHSSTAS